MGKIDLPKLEMEKKDTEVADTFSLDKNKILRQAGVEKEEEDENYLEKAEKLIRYKKFLDVDIGSKENLSLLSKIDKILEEEGLKTKEKKALKIKEIQYKISSKDLNKVYQYLKIENQIKSLVGKLKNI